MKSSKKPKTEEEEKRVLQREKNKYTGVDRKAIKILEKMNEDLEEKAKKLNPADEKYNDNMSSIRESIAINENAINDTKFKLNQPPMLATDDDDARLAQINADAELDAELEALAQEKTTRDQEEQHNTKIKQNVDEIFNRNQAERARKKAFIEEAIKPELEYCAPALEDPRDNYTIACKVLGIQDQNFYLKPNASNILQNASADKIKKCVTDINTYDKNNYKTNIEKAYHFLDNMIADVEIEQKMREEEEVIKNKKRVIDERKEAEIKRIAELNEVISRADQKVESIKKKELEVAEAKAEAEIKRIAELNEEISRADQNVKRIKKEEKKTTKKAAADAAIQKAAADAATQKAAADAATQKMAQKAAADAKEKNIVDQINSLNLSEEAFSQQKQELLRSLRRSLRQIRAQQPIQCEDEPPSLVGIDSDNFNNCYLNALFQMLFHMCYFRKAIIDNRQPNFSPAIDELSNILYQYQKLYLQNQYEVLFLTDNDYFFIKQATLENPEADIQQDPKDILTYGSKGSQFFDGTNGIAKQFIYNNPNNSFALIYVYPLIDSETIKKNLQYLIFIQEPTFFNGVQPNTDQKYIILNYPRFNDDGSKKHNSVEANPIIFINEIKFVLKGIIVHLGPNSDSGHYIYVTFTNDGREIDKIYDNSNVRDFNNRQIDTYTPNVKQKSQILQKRIEQFNKLMGDFINENEVYQGQLQEIQDDIIQKNYLLSFSENTLNEAFETFKKLFSEKNAEANGVFKNETDKNTIDFDSIQDTINRNGTIFLYENISSREPPGGPGAQGPSIIPAEKLQLQKATIAAMSLFKIPYNKTFFQIITAKELTNKKDNLLEEIENNVTDSPAELIEIVVFAYNYLIKILDKIGNKIIGRALNRLPLEKLNTFYESLKQDPKDYLLDISRKFLGLYKKLNYKKSMIIQTPKLNETRKATQGTICNELGQLNPLFNSQKGIPSILRKLTRKITREEIYKPIKARIAIKEADTKKAAEKKSKQTIEQIDQIDAAEKKLKEIKTQKIVERIYALSQEIDGLRENPRTTSKDINKKLGELRELKKLLESEEQQPPKKESRGGTNKIIRITKQNKKTRKLN